MRSYSFILYVFLGTWTLGCVANSRANSSKISTPAKNAPRGFTTQAELRAELDAYICAAWSEEANQWGAEFLSEACAQDAQSSQSPGPTKVATRQAVRAAVKAAEPFIILGSAAYDEFYAAAKTVLASKTSNDADLDETAKRAAEQPSMDALARAAFWSDPILSQTMWMRVHHDLRVKGLGCVDCPNPPDPGPVTTTWAEFSPYLRAYIWPVQETETSPVEVATCSEYNGVALLPKNEPLRKAAFLVAAGFAMDEAMARRIVALRDAYNLRRPRFTFDLGRKLYTFLQSPLAQAHACQTLTSLKWFTGLTVTDCAVNS